MELKQLDLNKELTLEEVQFLFSGKKNFKITNGENDTFIINKIDKEPIGYDFEKKEYKYKEKVLTYDVYKPNFTDILDSMFRFGYYECVELNNIR